jgi:hypothetical protein
MACTFFWAGFARQVTTCLNSMCDGSDAVVGSSKLCRNEGGNVELQSLAVLRLRDDRL